jgi:hypothetical protein
MIILRFEKLIFKLSGVLRRLYNCGRAHVSDAGDKACNGDGDILGLTPGENIYFISPS